MNAPVAEGELDTDLAMRFHIETIPIESDSKPLVAGQDT